MIRSLVCLALLLSCSVLAAPAAPAPKASPADLARLQWWQEARFGLFVHWGPVSLKGTEIGWSRAGERRGYRGPGTLVPTEVYDKPYLI